ncbi:Pao retrotransposon peptidase [Popillia japonica]|uniref:Pao retrotransposon peptidase n=1 Tax=Popillia japonica TaxID=7064 RepID=A0AAW1HRF2_POPJA
MYRQILIRPEQRSILIRPEQRSLQKILWRKNPSENISVYTLNTVTDWTCADDTFRFTINVQTERPITKRTILSDIAHIFDPLGVLSPCIVISKILLQKLWTLKISWDESLPIDIYTKWQNLRNELTLLNKIRIPRYIFNSLPVPPMTLFGSP